MARVIVAEGEPIEIQIGGQTIIISTQLSSSSGRSAVAAPPNETGKRGRKRRFSAASRAKMAEAQRKRWAGIHTKGKNAPPPMETPAPKRQKRRMSAAGRAKIAASAKARWAVAKKAGRTSL